MYRKIDDYIAAATYINADQQRGGQTEAEDLVGNK
jgi:hypothetical protein